MNASHNYTVLVVDDTGEVRDVTRRMLERSGYKVITASDGLEAAKAFCHYENVIDIVLLDLVMPELDGVEALKVIHGVQEDAKVVLVTGYPERFAADRWRELGFAAFIPKPYTSAQIISVVESVLNPKMPD